jgi:hypothetical protein
MQNFKARLVTIASATTALVASATAAMATPILDFTGVGTAVTGELSPAITAAMPIAGTILAAGIGWKLYKRFTK